MENTLIQIFKNDYNRDSFTENVLLPIFKNASKNFKLFDTAGLQEMPLTESELKTATKVIKYGEFTTHDNRKIDLYEVTITDHKQVKIARVGLGALVKKLIIGNNAVFATFKYENKKNKRWRFSFIAYDSFFEDGQVLTKETNPKRYTYVFGEKEETYRTAIDRFKTLYDKFELKVKDIQDAFAVEKMSEEFFKEYRETHYANFVKYLTGEVWIKKKPVQVQEPSSFLKVVFNGDKKEARDFCKKLLGQIVFLYFIQKKGWLGATNLNYKDGNGDKNFIQNFYNQAGQHDTFYSLWLSELFYNTLNKKREDDNFIMPNGEIVKIPYLNGGLFDKETTKYDLLTFPSDLFTNLFDFFNRYNFTIYENSPEEHTVAVDPEMLGHIFENLLEDNKDKGAFYTPKEIVQYMTQESLIAYLATHLGDNKQAGISQFVKQKDKQALTDDDLEQIDKLLDTVKICDPAIGSGAFPMGLLQEIFALKARIAFDLGFEVWSPATVKENIIQKSIYGVDIEKGAVDIARLRFWLSLIVDEDSPRPLPNLAYKIVVGNSLVSKFGEEIIEIDWQLAAGTQGNLFGNPYQEEIEQLLQQISTKQKAYFTADNTQKEPLAKAIRLLKLNILSKQLELMINTKGFEKVDSKRLTKAQTQRWLETEGWKKTLKQINTLKTNNKPFKHFDWKLDFPEILNPNVNDNCGFDIVIGNPPYLNFKMYSTEDKELYRLLYKDVFDGKADIYYYFYKKSYELSKNNATISLITSRYWIEAEFAKKLRYFLAENVTFLNIIDFKNVTVFDGIGIKTCVTSFKKTINSNDKDFYYRFHPGKKIKYIDLSEYVSIAIPLKNISKTSWNLNDRKTTKIIDTIENETILLGEITDCKQGIVTGLDKAFISTDNSFKNLPKKIIKPWLKVGDIHKYSIVLVEIRELVYTKLIDDINDYSILKERFLPFKKKLENRREAKNGRIRWFDLQWPREQKLFNSEKLICRFKAENNTFCYDNNGFYSSADTTVVAINEKGEGRFLLKYLLALLNSKLLTFYFKTYGKLMDYRYEYYPSPVSKLRIKESNEQEIFVNIVDYILYLKSNGLNSINSELIEVYFEQIIDGMVYELYFPELLKQHNRTIIEHLGELPRFTTEMTNSDKETIINNVFKRLDDKNHPVRNNLFYMRNIEEIAIIENLKK